MAKTISVLDLGDAVHDIIQEYFDGISTDATELVAKVAAETVQELKATSPVDTGKYASGWRIKQGKRLKASNQVEVYNSKWQLTHLLEHGHIKVVHGKVLGFTAPRPHIKTAEQHAINKLVEGIERSAK